MVRLNLIACLAIGVAFSAAGCGNSSEYKKVDEVKKAPKLPDHDHGAKGPHGGSIVELGEEEYHAEVLVDHDTESVKVFVLGKDAKTPAPVAAADVTIAPEGDGKEPLTLKAAPEKEDGEGKASKFELVNEDVVHALLKDGFLHGELRIKIADKPYMGKIDYHLEGGDHHHDHNEKK